MPIYFRETRGQVPPPPGRTSLHLPHFVMSGCPIRTRQRNMSLTVEDVQAKPYSIRHAAKVFGVPKSMIPDRVSDRIEMGAKPGRSLALPRAVDERIVKAATVAAQKGTGVSRRQLLLKTGRICQSLNLRTPFKNSTPGKDWFHGLQKRFPELTTESQNNLGLRTQVVVEK